MKSILSKFRKNLFLIFFFYLLISWYLFYVTKDRINEITKQELQIGKEKRFYYISSSAKKLAGKNAPLLIFLHGMDNSWPDKNSTKLQYNYIDTLALKRNFIAVFPGGSPGSCDWDNNKYKNYYCWSTREEHDRNFIRILTNEIEKKYQTDPQKVFLTGFSNGGYFVISYLLRHHDNGYSGYGIHAGGGYLFKNDPILNNKYKFPIFMSVGNKDTLELVPMRNLKGSLVKLGWKLDINLIYQEFAGGHSLNKDDLKKEFDFFFKK